MTFLVGLTGGIGSGKSMVSKALQARSVAVIDADLVAREVVGPGSEALAAITGHFGADLVDSQGQLKRTKLRQIIFLHSEAKIWLENLLHPQINERIKQQLQRAAGAYSVLVSPLLLETEQKRLVDYVVVVDATEFQQIERTGIRDGKEDSQVEAILKSQLSREARLADADYIVDNTGSQAELAVQIDLLHNTLLEQAKS